jgi:hypothetical protein
MFSDFLTLEISIPKKKKKKKKEEKNSIFSCWREMNKVAFAVFFLSLCCATSYAWPLPLPLAPIESPVWPDEFIAEYRELAFASTTNNVSLPETLSMGKTWYSWSNRAQRNDHFQWCFDFCKQCDCSFLMVGNLYFKSGDTCCKLMDGIHAVPPDWLKTSSYVGVETIVGEEAYHYFALNDHHTFQSVKEPSRTVRYQDSGFGVALQFSDFVSWQIQDEPLPSDLFELGQECEVQCPAKHPFIGMAQYYAARQQIGQPKN